MSEPDAARELHALRAVVTRVLRQGGGVALLREHLNTRPADGSDTATEWAYQLFGTDDPDVLQPCTADVAQLRLADGRRRVFTRQVTATPWAEVTPRRRPTVAENRTVPIGSGQVASGAPVTGDVVHFEVCDSPTCAHASSPHGHVADVVVTVRPPAPPRYVYEVVSNVPLVASVGLGNVSTVAPSSFAWGRLDVGQSETVHDGPQSIHDAEITITRRS